MKKTLLALSFIAALPGCGCMRKSTTKAEKPKKAMNYKMGDKVKAKKGAAKTHMDMQSAY